MANQIATSRLFRRIAAGVVLLAQGGVVVWLTRRLALHGLNPSDAWLAMLIGGGYVAASAALILGSGRKGQVGTLSALAGALLQLPVLLFGLFLLFNPALFFSAVVALFALMNTPLTNSRTGVCPSCEYDLAGLDGTRCPECGTPNPRP